MGLWVKRSSEQTRLGVMFGTVRTIQFEIRDWSGHETTKMARVTMHGGGGFVSFDMGIEDAKQLELGDEIRVTIDRA